MVRGYICQTSTSKYDNILDCHNAGSAVQNSKKIQDFVRFFAFFCTLEAPKVFFTNTGWSANTLYSWKKYRGIQKYSVLKKKKRTAPYW